MARPDSADFHHSWLTSALSGKNVCVRHDEFDSDSLNRLLGKSNCKRLARLGRDIPDVAALVADVFFLLFKGSIRFEDYDALAPQAKFHRAMLEERVVAAPVFAEARQQCFTRATASFEAALAIAAAVSAGLSADEVALVDKIDKADRDVQNAMGSLKGVKGAKAAAQFLRVDERPAETGDNPENARMLNRLRDPGSFSPNKRHAQSAETVHGTHSRNAADILPYHERVNLKEQLMALEKFRRFLELAFDLRTRSANTVEKFLELRHEEIHTIASGNDLALLLPIELAALGRTPLKKGFLKRFVDRELMTYDMNRLKKRGPIIVCVDTSHSMSGENEIYSKALSLALRDIARRHDREFRAILFGGGDEQRVLDFRNESKDDLVDLAEFNFGAGTNFEKPLLMAMKMQVQSGLTRGDIIFMTDGRSEIAAAVRDRILWTKRKLSVKITSLVMNLGKNTEAALRAPLSDKILFAADFAEMSVTE